MEWFGVGPKKLKDFVNIEPAVCAVCVEQKSCENIL